MYEGIARLIGAQVDGVDYFDTAGSNIFLDRMATEPDNAVAVYPQPATTPDSKLGYDPVAFQVVVRGDPDGIWAHATGKAIFDLLHGLRNTTLPDGTEVIFIIGQTASPFSIGDDQEGRPQLAWDFNAEIRNTAGGRE